MLKMVDGKWVLAQKCEPVSFWPYSTVVMDRTMQKDYKAGDACSQLLEDLLKLFKENGFKDVGNDNKIAFCLRTEKGKTFYIGFKDWVMSVGTDIRTDEWNKTREQKFKLCYLCRRDFPCPFCVESLGMRAWKLSRHLPEDNPTPEKLDK